MLNLSCSADNKFDSKPDIDKNDSNSVLNNRKCLNNKVVIDNLFDLSMQYFLTNYDSYSPIFRFDKESLYLWDKNQYFMNMKVDSVIRLFEITQNEIKPKNFVLFYDESRMNASTILDYDTYNNQIYFLTKEQILVYSIDNCKFRKNIDLINGNWGKIEIIDDVIYVYSMLYGNAYKNKTPKILSINLLNGKNKNIVEFNNPKGAMMTFYQPNRTFGVYKKGIFLSDNSKYNIRFFDFEGNLQSEIKYKPQNGWLENDSIQIKLDKFYNLDSFRMFNKGIPNISYIKYVDFINDSTIFITRYKDKSFEVYCDIWIFTGNKWTLHTESLHTSIGFTKEITGKISFLNFSSFYIKDNKIVFFDSNPWDINDEEMNKLTYKEVLKKMNDYYKKNPTSLSIYKYKFRDLKNEK